MIPKGTYPGQTTDNPQATVQNLIVAHENMSEQLAYNITKTIFDHQKELIAVHKEASSITLANQKEAQQRAAVASGRAAGSTRRRASSMK